ncbi:ABC transporter substrate-binding protein [Cupriavidus basilensis]|uniref:ABC transporter substrate-binding protein n=1 Tax=Cupriavidus basilensis TaxID=68895 RepID=A0ABT6API2_9BURK|nr:ABC transporter substrate-binding protein [Cupriavidus basilensis]MDF3834531.1 ABC transporter substrate-binding protein [Cupriavidus basilensis]
MDAHDNSADDGLIHPGRRAILRGGAALGAAALAGAWSPLLRADTAGKLKIGFVTPRTGPLAPFAEADAFVIGQMKARFANGLEIGGKTYAVEILVKDSTSNPSRAADVAADLILRDKVNLMLVSSTPETTNPVSDQCELNRTPCISTVAPWQPWFFTRGGKPDKGFDWTYHFFWGLEDVVGVFASMWSSIATNKRVGGMFPNDGDGNAWGDRQRGFPPALSKDHFALTDPGRYQNLSSDFSAQIQRFKAGQVEIVTGVMIPPDFATFWNQSQQKGFRPKVATIGKALLFPSSLEALGDKGDGLSSEVWWTPNHPFKSSLTGQSSRDLALAFEAQTGKQWTQPIGFAHALFEIAADVLRRTSDPGKPAAIRDALAATDLNTIVGPVKFAGGPVKNVAKTPLVGGQWRRTGGGKHKYDLAIVDNSRAPMVPVQDKLKPLA